MQCFIHALILANVATGALVSRQETTKPPPVADGPTFEEWKQGQANASAAMDAEAAKEAKMAAVGKIIAMLGDVRQKVMFEGDAEAKTYNEFACFCKDTIAEKTAAIQTGEDEKSNLEAAIAADSDTRDGLDRKIQKLMGEIEKAHKEVAAAKEVRASELALYTASAADVDAGITALDGAIKVLKASKQPSLLQLQGVQKTVRTATLIADSLGLVRGSAKAAIGTFLQQAPDVPFENYKFHSQDIIDTLEQLKKDFAQTKIDLDAAEVEAKKVHTQYLQDMDAKIKDFNVDLEDTKTRKAKTIAKIKTDSEQLSTVAAELLDDKQYLEALAEMCQDKRKTWDQRSNTRRDELHTLTEVIGIMEGALSNKTRAETVRFNQVGVSLKLAKAVALDRSTMEAVEEEAEAAEGPADFLQRASSQRHLGRKPSQDSRQMIVSMLRSKATQLKSEALSALAMQVAAVQGEDPFAKVKQLIQELIERLLQQAANEATQKGWCDKVTSAATQKRNYAAEEVRDLNAEMAQLEATRDKLAEELGVLAKGMQELVDSRREADKIRAKEQVENEYTIEEAKAGLQAIDMAMDILDKWYKTNAKNEVPSMLQQSPAEDAPDAGFKNFEAYTGMQGEAYGILGMMEVIQSDFQRTISETQKAEAEAEAEHLEFMTETGKSLGEKKMAADQKQNEKDSAEEDLESAGDKLSTEAETLQTSIKELIELKAACIDTGMSYEERVARREEEIEALKKALCILDAYQKYGPDGMGDAC